jgi:hypothetical protein
MAGVALCALVQLECINIIDLIGKLMQSKMQNTKDYPELERPHPDSHE